jgi:heme o synthase
MRKIKTYYQLTKPGIIYGNLMFAVAGFLLAAKGHIQIWRLIAMLAGLGLVIGAACVFNNVIDRGIDSRMARTKKRALAAKTVLVRSALIYGTILGLAGFGLTVAYTNWLTTILEAAAFVIYVGVYAVAKRKTVEGTIIGSLAGSAPPVVGYCAVTNHLDSGALLLFLILTFWQMPHFYAIATYRIKDYAAAGLPVLTVKRGIKPAKYQIAGYIVGFIAACVMLSVFGYTGYSYLVVMLALGLAWLRLALKGFTASDDSKWAKQVFLFSLLITVCFSLLLALNAWLP